MFVCPSVTTGEMKHLTPVTPEHIRYKCREWSRKISMKVTMTKRKIPPMLVLSKVYNDHYLHLSINGGQGNHSPTNRKPHLQELGNLEIWNEEQR